ncbi:F-box associated domain-containing protein [Caenorhabditis elegans]|uniref:F-box associated domain-containing protein n=1 Tax=Caenorhabditis elegans TaxID=6239 RepID=O16577_CAEEL|nr:F-box associated domain-containing protein [Caenorhabditis elegans]CCD66455.1 F-box associated domain-containing protein [Caenorhabditis elegans]|eukprot:NP_494204.2 F-box B protein [Caenorhabditis elegans]
MDAVSFPILRLPQPALKNALRQMFLVEHISLSVLSAKAKQQVAKLNEIRGNIYLFVSSSMVGFNLRSKWIHFDLSVDLDKSTIEIRKHEAPRYELTNLSMPGFTAKQWIDHIGCVFLKNGNLTLLVQNPQRRMIEERYEYIREFRIVKLEIYSAEIQESPLYDMFPLLKCLSFGPFPRHQSILIQNADKFIFNESKFTLNEILLCNCSSISVDNQVTSDKDLNRFMKHWIKGSNHRLELFQYHCRPNNRALIVESELFKGIDYKVEQMDRYWKQFEIERNDGTKAMIAFGENGFVSFIMCVSPLVLLDVPNFNFFY